MNRSLVERSPMLRYFRTLLAGSLLLSLTGCASVGTDYYVRLGGSDQAAGTSAAQAWASCGRVNQVRLGPGDRVLFEAGARFEGPLELDAQDAGRGDAPVVVGSFGEGRATILGGAGSAILVRGSRHLVIRELRVEGLGRLSGNLQGVGVRLAGARSVRVEGVEASGFQRAGVEFSDCDDLRLTNIYAHENGFAGICSTAPLSRRIYIGHCRAINNPGDPTILKNHSGNGIVLYQVSGATIQYCEAAENGWDMPWRGNGPVGIWAANNSDHVLIQFCVSHHNKSPGDDGGGFDFDGGVRDSIMQFNYSHHNAGWGYLLYEYGSRWPFRNNVIRYCISENDADAGIGVGEAAVGPFTGGLIHNNVIYNDNGAPCVKFFEGEPENFRFYNNVFIAKGGPHVVNAERARFLGNCYGGQEGRLVVDAFRSLEAWSRATGQETVKGRRVGLVADPMLVAPGAGGGITPERLGELHAYRLRAGSPLVDRGLDLRRLLGADVGTRDFYGNPIPAGTGYDIGLHEWPVKPAR